MDIQIADRFAKYYPNFDKCLVQIFDDVETRKNQALAREALRWNDETRKICEEANKNNCGIFFSVNQITGNKRWQENVSEITTRVVEIDNVSKEEQMRLMELSPLQPSMAVESNRSFHFYRWAKDGKKENWRKIMRWIRNFFQWDHKIITEERVLRIPWFDHCKDPSNKFETTYRPLSWKQYTEEEMLKAFPDTTNKKEQEKKMKQFANTDDFWKRACSVNSEYMLSLLSWTKRVNWEIITIEWWQIFVNWKSTSSWIDKNWLIGSHDNWWPTRTQRISWYGTVDRKELYDWLIQKMPELKPKEEKQVQKESTISKIDSSDFFIEYNRNFKIDTETIVPFTWWSKKLDDYFWRIEKGRFMTTLGESWSWKTTFAFNQLIEMSRNYKVLFISLEMSAQRVIELRARKMAWITNAEWNEKNIPQTKICYMEERKKEIVENKNLEIVWVNKKAEIIHIDLVLEAIRKKYMMYDFITIDNLWFIKSDDANAYKEVNDIIRKMKNFCHDENKNINLLHHFNKGKWDRRSRTFADVLWTGKLENDIDIWVSIMRYLDDRETLTEEEKQQVFVKVMKNRDTWETKKETLFFKKWKYRDNLQIDF